MLKTTIRSVIALSIGNIIGWYEYALYAYFATIISQLFFPMDSHFISIILTFATFTISLAARPIGGIVFGYIGDRYSRKMTLSLSMLLMSIPTMLIGLLPTYHQIGIAAPIFLVIFRVLQGFALGGEFGMSCVYLYEYAPENRRGFFSSMALTGAGCGLVLSACTIFIVESLVTEKELYLYAWRIPFFVSVLGSIVAFYLRRALLETEDFIIARRKGKLLNNPFIEMIKNYKIKLFQLFMIFFSTQVSFFIVFIYGKTMMIDCLQYDSRTASIFNLFTMISYTISTLVFGFLADKIDKRYIIFCGILGLFVFAYPFIEALEVGRPSSILILSILMGGFIGMIEGTLNTLVAESFPTNIRATSLSFCWNFTAVIFGGAAPVISIWLIKNAGGIESIAYYLIVVNLVSLISMGINLLKHKLI